jgi:hypothetical protein
VADRGWALPDGRRIDVFAEQDAVGGRDVAELWIAEAGLSRAEAERRVAEILLVATDRERRPIGVTTTYLERNHQLRADMWYLRAFVAAAHRRSQLGLELARISRDHLAQRFVEGSDRRGLGVIFEIENEMLKHSIPEAVWPRLRFVFIGETAHGSHVRVYYFPGALAPESEPGST